MILDENFIGSMLTVRKRCWERGRSRRRQACFDAKYAFSIIRSRGPGSGSPSEPSCSAALAGRGRAFAPSAASTEMGSWPGPASRALGLSCVATPSLSGASSVGSSKLMVLPKYFLTYSYDTNGNTGPSAWTFKKS